VEEKNILITGGAGFIGSHVVRRFVSQYPAYRIFNLDKLTYAGNLENLKDIEGNANYTFIKGDITDADFITHLFRELKPDGVIHLAAESHVDRSITNPLEFVMTNVLGTVNLLNAARLSWNNNGKDNLFYHVSTDEVYGELGDEGKFTETTPYSPNSPYSSSKASSDHFVRAYHHTYGLPVKISNCSNNYGSHHFPEKLIPLMINNIMNSKDLPVYGKGENVRDWLFVEDHAHAIDVIYHKGKLGETYNIGGNNEWKNIELVQFLCRLMDRKLGRAEGESGKLMNELHWKPSVTFEQGLEKTVDWYLANQDWLNNVTSGAYQKYYDSMYINR
jgi:dTDP-glucose 4,6-dehydratase